MGEIRRYGKRESRRQFKIEKELLEKLVWEIPCTTIAKNYGVSDNAVNKRCKLLGIDKPPRGYWQKKLQAKRLKKL